MSDTYRKVGRGGAGNYIPRDQADAAEQAQNQDEAEMYKTTTNTHGNDPYVRAGRGGAGNFVDPSSLPGKGEREAAAGRTQNAVSASIARASDRPAYSGRGGAGNWSTAATGDANGSGGKSVQDELERKIVEDVDAGLARPGKAYTGSPKEKIKGRSG